MAADLKIHVFEGITEEDLKVFSSDTLGSKHFSFGVKTDWDAWDQVYYKIAATPSVSLGEVSWLKAAIFEDGEKYVPQALELIQRIIGEDLPIIDNELIEKIVEALDTDNKTGYSLTNAEPVKKFLKTHKGKKVFTVSW